MSGGRTADGTDAMATARRLFVDGWLEVRESPSAVTFAVGASTPVRTLASLGLGLLLTMAMRFTDAVIPIGLSWPMAMGGGIAGAAAAWWGTRPRRVVFDFLDDRVRATFGPSRLRRGVSATAINDVRVHRFVSSPAAKLFLDDDTGTPTLLRWRTPMEDCDRVDAAIEAIRSRWRLGDADRKRDRSDGPVSLAEDRGWQTLALSAWFAFGGLVMLGLGGTACAWAWNADGKDLLAITAAILAGGPMLLFGLGLSGVAWATLLTYERSRLVLDPVRGELRRDQRTLRSRRKLCVAISSLRGVGLEQVGQAWEVFVEADPPPGKQTNIRHNLTNGTGSLTSHADARRLADRLVRKTELPRLPDEFGVELDGEGAFVGVDFVEPNAAPGVAES